LFPARNQGLDAVNYAITMEEGTISALFHPHHLLYNPLGWLLFNAAQWFGHGHIPILHLMVTVSSIFGTLGAILFGAMVFQLTGKKMLALIIPLLLAFSYGYWYSSLNGESYIISIFFLIVCLYLVLMINTGTGQLFIVFLALAHGIATLFHQSHILFLIPVSFFLYKKGGIRTLWSYCFVFAMIVGSVYLWACYLTNNLSSLKDFLEWITRYAQGKPPNFGHFHIVNIPVAIISLGRSVLYGSYIGDLLLDRIFDINKSGLIISTILVLGIIFYFVLVLFRDRNVMGRQGDVNRFCIIWIASYFAFFVWWDPGNFDFMMTLLIPCYLLFSIFLNHAESKYRMNRNLALALAILLFLSNFFAEILPGSKLKNNQSYQLASSFKNYVSKEDLVLVNDPVLLPYSRYYFHKEFTQAYLATLEFSPEKESRLKAVNVLKGKIENTLKAGGKVFIAENEAYPKKLRRFNKFSREEFELAYNGYKPYLKQIFSFSDQGEKIKMFVIDSVTPHK